MDSSERLFAAILQMDFAAADNLTAAGASLDGDIRDALVKGPGTVYDSAQHKFFWQFMNFAECASAADFAAVTEKLFGIVGEPLYNMFGEYRHGAYKNVFCDPVFFEALLKYCNGKQMRKQMTMREIIDKNSAELLALCAKYGWLKLPRVRDAMIEYSEDKNKTECTAFLLDFKNKNFDLAAERALAEKRMQRELNADPNSLSELKKIWKFDKREDGTIIILGYKGDRTEIVVPERIGGDTVTALGEYAFSPDAKRIREEQRALRKETTKVTLPDTIESIGEFAFFKCKSLSEINFPERLTEISKGMLDITGLESIIIGGNVGKIGAVAFWGCRDLKYVKLCEGVSEIDEGAFYNCTNLETIELPRSLEKSAPHTMSEGAFWNCHKLTALVHKGSYAEEYCVKNGVKFVYRRD